MTTKQLQELPTEQSLAVKVDAGQVEVAQTEISAFADELSRVTRGEHSIVFALAGAGELLRVTEAGAGHRRLA